MSLFLYTLIWLLHYCTIDDDTFYLPFFLYTLIWLLQYCWDSRLVIVWKPLSIPQQPVSNIHFFLFSSTCFMIHPLIIYLYQCPFLPMMILKVKEMMAKGSKTLWGDSNSAVVQ